MGKGNFLLLIKAKGWKCLSALERMWKWDRSRSPNQIGYNKLERPKKPHESNPIILCKNLARQQNTHPEVIHCLGTQVHAQRKTHRERERAAYFVVNCDTMKVCMSSYCGQVPCTYCTEADV